MILIDANLLLHAYNSSSDSHQPARAWLEAVLSKPEPVRLAWITVLAFLRIGANTRAFETPLSVAEATSVVSDWLGLPMVAILSPGENHWEILNDLLREAQAHGPLVMDAHLAALAIEHGAVLCTTDRDFSRFPGLQLLNPIEKRSGV